MKWKEKDLAFVVLSILKLIMLKKAWAHATAICAENGEVDHICQFAVKARYHLTAKTASLNLVLLPGQTGDFAKLVERICIFD